MFHVKDGGVSDPIKWSKDNLQQDRSIIILDEGTSILFLWHGTKQGLVQRRTALRQAQSLKGHGYTIGRSIIGRDTKEVIEIDARKIGREPTTTELNKQLEEVLNKKYHEMGEFIVSFDTGSGIPVTTPKPFAKTKPTPAKAAAKPAPAKAVAKPKPAPVKAVTKPAPKTKKVKFASEYNEPETKIAPVQYGKENLISDARVGMVLVSVLSKYDDIWVSKKSDGSYSVEMMDGPICMFTISGTNIKFTSSSFSGISTNIKADIQKIYANLSKLI
jgi:hypothetical protein